MQLELIGLFALLGGAVIYALWRERAVRALARRLSRERDEAEASSGRVRDLSAVSSASVAVHGLMDLDDVLRIALDEALILLQGSEGSIMLLDGAGYLQTACVQGNELARGARVKLGEGVAGRVALTRRPTLIEGEPDPEEFPRAIEREQPLRSAMSVPLLRRDEVVGVININGGPDRSFTNPDVELLTAFAGHAATALDNARALAAERTRATELGELNRLKTRLIADTASDLRGPIESVRDSIRSLGAGDPLDRDDDLDEVNRQLDRLASVVERLGSGPGRERTPGQAVPACDLATVARTVADDFDADGQRVEVTAVGTCRVRGDRDLLRQALWNLVENAFAYGRPPVSIEVADEGGQGVVSVIDHGPGLSNEDRERLFEQTPGEAGERGMGVGLSIVHGIVSATGGRLWADNLPEGGAAFRIALPLATPATPHRIAG